MHFRANFLNLDFPCSPCLLWISCTTSNLVFGKQYLSTSYIYWTATMKALNMTWTKGKHDLLVFQGPYIHWPLRFCEIPPFGEIRRIRTNRSEPKKMTAHDFEDLLQVTVVLLVGLNIH